jgi:flagellin-specific chaperone FliS
MIIFIYGHKSQVKAIGDMMAALDSQKGQQVAELDFVTIYEYITRFMFQMGCFT